MSLIKWDPFHEFNRLARMSGFPERDWEKAMSTTAWNPYVDIFENEEAVVVKAELPGMKAREIEVRLENNVLMIKGERHFEKETKEENYHRVEREFGTFNRTFTLPASVNEEKVVAEYKDGILKITLPKKEEAKRKAIRIEAA